MRLILHIGLPKTGTTFLQQQFHHHRRRLADNGILYPHAGTLGWVRDATGTKFSRLACEENNHVMLAWALQRERTFPEQIARMLPIVWDALRKEVDTAKAQCCLISAENLSWDLHSSEQVGELRDRLGFSEVKVVCTIRDPAEFIASMYGQLLRMDRGPYTLDAFVREFGGKWEPRYYQRLWGAVFGEQNIQFLRYGAEVGDDAMRAFLGSVVPEMQVGATDYPTMPNTNPNRSASPRFVRLLEELHANGIDTARFEDIYGDLPPHYKGLEARLVTAQQIEAALHRQGLPPISSDLASAAEPNPIDTLLRERTLQLDRTSNALAEVTAELLRVRQLLQDRTASNERSLAEVTADLVRVRKLLQDRTVRLEGAGTTPTPGALRAMIDALLRRTRGAKPPHQGN